MIFKEKRNYWTLTCFLPLLSFFICVEYICLRYFTNDKFGSFLIFVIFGAGFIVVLRTFLWTMFGREHVAISKDFLIIHKLGTFWTSPQKISLKEMKNLRFENRSFHFWEFFASKTSLTTLNSYGPVVFQFQNKTLRIGGDIDDKEAKKTLEMLAESVKSALLKPPQLL